MLQEKKNHNNRLPDYHMHTTLCHHATGTPAQYRKAAAGFGIPEICFVDHAPNPDGYDPKHRMALNEFGGYREGYAKIIYSTIIVTKRAPARNL